MYSYDKGKSIRNTEFKCSKIKVIGEEVIRSGLFIWEEVGVEKGWYKRKEGSKKWKRDKKKPKTCYWCCLRLPAGSPMLDH